LETSSSPEAERKEQHGAAAAGGTESLATDGREGVASVSANVLRGFLSGIRTLQETSSSGLQEPVEERAGRVLLACSASPERGALISQLAGCELTVVEEANAALETGIEGIEVVLVDEDLPPWGGPELCRRLLADKRLTGIPVAIVASRENEEAMEGVLAGGAHEVLVKPCHPAETRIRVQNMVQRHRNFGELEKRNRILKEALSDLCQSEAMLVQAEKLSLLGEMSAGIVHEINNPLNYSKTALFVLRSLVHTLEGGRREEFAEVVNDISEGMERVDHIVRDLRAFATQGPIRKVELNLVSVVRTARRLLGDRLGAIRYEEDVPEELRIRGNENQLCQVALNILKNGVEATEMAGRSQEEAEMRVWAREVGSWVELHFRDNGCGIPEGEQRRIFEPFFSNKGEGMGMGLSICGRILEEHRAKISVQSEVGRYTQFTIRFPLEEDEERSTPGSGGPRG